MKKSILVLVALLIAFAPAYAQEANKEAKKSEVKSHLKQHFKPYGFIRNYFTYDSRESISGMAMISMQQVHSVSYPSLLV